jgi:ankyrin repeat protein
MSTALKKFDKDCFNKKKKVIHKMKNFSKIIFVMLVLLSQTAFSSSSIQKMTPQQSLIQAIYSNDLTGAQAAIKNGATVNTPDASGATPLMQASLITYTTMPSVIPYLVLQGASLTAKDHNGCTPLDYALLGFTPTTIAFLENKNAPTGTNPLVNAINQNNIPALKKALKDGANPNLIITGQPLLVLLMSSNAESIVQIVEILLKSGANVNLQDSTGATALMYAAQEGNEPLVKTLITAGAKTTPQANQTYTATALIIAITAQTPSLPIIKILLKASDIKDSINLQDTSGLTALMWAAKTGNLAAVEALITAGADVTIVTPQEQTAFSVSAPNCKSVLQAAYQNTPIAKANDDLLSAVLNSNFSGVKNALAAGANPSHLVEYSGITRSMLILAIAFNYVAIAQELIAAKANLDFQDTTGGTALMYAVQTSNEALVKALITAGAKTTLQANQANQSSTALIIAVSTPTPSLPIIKTLLQAPDIKASINVQDTTGSTALMYAVQTGNKALVKALAKVKGINANIQDNTGMTALMYATSNNNGNINGNLLPILKLLIKIPGINLNLKNNYKNAPMQCSTNKWNQENPENTVMTGCTALDYIGSANNISTGQSSNNPSYYNDYTTFLTKVGAVSEL